MTGLSRFSAARSLSALRSICSSSCSWYLSRMYASASCAARPSEVLFASIPIFPVPSPVERTKQYRLGLSRAVKTIS